jgi:hypothetical protein
MRHSGENLDKKRAECRTIPLGEVQRMVREHHYARGGSNTATFRHGLFYDGRLVGCAWWIPPTKTAAQANWHGDWREVLTLSRLVCTPDAPRNSASFLLSRSVKLIQKDGRFRRLLTYADEWQGHSGQIYRAANWQYLGKTNPEATFVSAEGVMMGRKRGPRTLTRAEMEAAGFRMIGRFSRHRFGKTV